MSGKKKKEALFVGTGNCLLNWCQLLVVELDISFEYPDTWKKRELRVEAGRLDIYTGCAEGAKAFSTLVFGWLDER